MPGERSSIPSHLLRFVVQQDYQQYTAVDQAVWRFVLLQLATRLEGTAHSAYRAGLSLTGISVDRIPRIEEMDEKLSRFGWGAVCVDGFIPPRAFQEFQAAGFLPIAADMRTLPHLVYTPAPDIIHEAAGHAPILSDGEYAAYIKRSGEIGARAFTLPQDNRVFQAIYTLSEVKENPEATREQVRQAELELERTMAESSELSEASRLARLYWWTAEYGLIGSPDDYRLYGAGLLSSLWESYACHDPGVLKIPLSAACLDVAYDITKPQPQLFVARDFADLETVLGEVEKTLASSIGGDLALDWAERSCELATLSFDRELELLGVLRQVWRHAERPALLELEGPVGFARGGSLLADCPITQSHLQPLGSIEGAVSVAREAERLVALPAASSAEVRFGSGVRLLGTAPQAVRDQQGALLALRFERASLIHPERGELHEGPYVWLAAEVFCSARAGASDPAFHRPTKRSTLRVPKARRLPEREARLQDLYVRGESVMARVLDGQARSELERLHRQLQLDFPDEWLLRWNLLETLLKLGERHGLSSELQGELEALEVRYEHREPITSGLRYLARAFSLNSSRPPC